MLHRRRDEFVLLTESAVAVALSVLLGTVRLVELPNGGSIALATLPLLALAIVRGPRAGIAAGACAGVAHALSGGTIIHPAQLGLDYLVAYAALGLAGVSAGRGTSRMRIAPGIVLGMLVHLAAMVLSGVIFFSTVAGSAALEYAIAYNAATVLPELALALWLVPSVARAIARADPAGAWRANLLTPPRLTPRISRRHTTRMSIDTSLRKIDTESAATDRVRVAQPSRAVPRPPRLTPAPPPPRAASRSQLTRPAPFERRWMSR